MVEARQAGEFVDRAMSWGAQHQTTMAMVMWTLEALGLLPVVWVAFDRHVLGRHGHKAIFDGQGMQDAMVVPLVHHIALPTMRDYMNGDALPPGILWRSGPMGHVDLLQAQATAVRRWVEAFPACYTYGSHRIVHFSQTR